MTLVRSTPSTTKEVPTMKIFIPTDLGAAPACGVAGLGTA
jgi:hypothetical protein